MMLTVLAVMFAMPMGAQTPTTVPTCKVTGTVMDKETGEPEMMATVCVAHKSLPGTGVKKVLADSVGRFEAVVPVMPGQYTVTAAMVGRVAEPRRFALTEGQEVMDIGAVYVADDVKMLKEVTVDAQKPLVTMDVDKLTYDVASDPDAKILRLSEMMGKVPLISVDGEGNIEMNGTKKFLILQNGRKTAVTRNPKEVLRSLPAEMVKSIEVITSPGARYDAEGIGGVINIVMRSQYEGHLTTLSASAGTTAYDGGVMTMSKIGKFAFDANFSYNRILAPEDRTSLLRNGYGAGDVLAVRRTGTQLIRQRGDALVVAPSVALVVQIKGAVEHRVLQIAMAQIRVVCLTVTLAPHAGTLVAHHVLLGTHTHQREGNHLHAIYLVAGVDRGKLGVVLRLGAVHAPELGGEWRHGEPDRTAPAL
mgnify:CR=1 FL=1